MNHDSFKSRSSSIGGINCNFGKADINSRANKAPNYDRQFPLAGQVADEPIFFVFVQPDGGVALNVIM